MSPFPDVKGSPCKHAFAEASVHDVADIQDVKVVPVSAVL